MICPLRKDADGSPAEPTEAEINSIRNNPERLNEIRQRLSDIRPHSLGQALRISGITPADVTVLAIHLAARK